MKRQQPLLAIVYLVLCTACATAIPGAGSTMTLPPQRTIPAESAASVPSSASEAAASAMAGTSTAAAGPEAQSPAPSATSEPAVSATGTSNPTPIGPLVPFVVPPGSATALINANVIDGAGAPPQSGWTVLIQGTHIAAVGPNVTIPAGAHIVDLQGKTVLPGLIDMHAHLYASDGLGIRNQPRAYPRLYLAGGVTTIFTAGDFDPEGTLTLRDGIALGVEPGPQILAAGPYFNGPFSRGMMPSTATVDELMALYSAWRDRIDGIKVYAELPEDQLAALIQAAEQDGLFVTGHLGAVPAGRAIELGIDGIEHGLFSMSELWPPGTSLEGQYCAIAELDLQSSQATQLIDAIVARQVYLDPTIVVFQPDLADFEPVTADWERYIAGSALNRVQQLVRSLAQADDTCLIAALQKQAQFVKAVHERGGLIVTGTDPVLPILTPGYALHRELRNLVEAGLTPLEAIRASTANAARALKLDAEKGTVAAGKIADLVVVAGDPAADIAAIGETVLVFRAGVPYDPVALRESVVGTIGAP